MFDDAITLNRDDDGYVHRWIDGSPIDIPVGKVVCVGRNYVDHARELGNEVPESPILFMKPATALASLHEPVVIPTGQGPVHHEVEMVVLIGKRIRKETDLENIRFSIAAYGVGLDLTLRALQNQLKEKGLPWERAKAFDGACPLSPFVPADKLPNKNIHFTLDINGQRQQTGDTRDMLNPIVPLIAHMSSQFTLQPGDVVLTGTPKGVGPLESGQTLSLELEDLLFVETTVV